MGCIHYQSSLFLPMSLHLKQKCPLASVHQSLFLQTQQPPTKLQTKHQSISLSTPQALPSTSLILGFTSSPSASGNIFILIGVSAPLLIFYWVANFIVPSILSKDPNEDQATSADKNPIEDEWGI